jgi:hypothetical protein
LETKNCLHHHQQQHHQHHQSATARKTIKSPWVKKKQTIFIPSLTPSYMHHPHHHQPFSIVQVQVK